MNNIDVSHRFVQIVVDHEIFCVDPFDPALKLLVNLFVCGDLLTWAADLSEELIHVGHWSWWCVTCHWATSTNVFEKGATRWLTSARPLETGQTASLLLVENICSCWTASMCMLIFSTLWMLINWRHRSLFLEFDKWLRFFNFKSIFKALRVSWNSKLIRCVHCRWKRRYLFLFNKWVKVPKDITSGLILFF